MIEYIPRGTAAILFRITGTVIPHAILPALLVSSFATIITVLRYLLIIDLSVGPTCHRFISVALGLVLTFRTNSCNFKYNEGLTLTSALTNASRNLLRQVMVYLPTASGIGVVELKNDVRRLTAAFWIATRQHLRNEYIPKEFEGVLHNNEIRILNLSQRLPQEIGLMLAAVLQRGLENRWISEVQHRMMDAQLSLMIESWGHMIRIQENLTPFAYAHHIKVFLYFYCLTIPFAMLQDMGMLTPVAAAFISYVLFGIDEIGVEIEEPFGHDPNDLPMDRVSEAFRVLGDETLQLHMYMSKVQAHGIPLFPEPLQMKDRHAARRISAARENLSADQRALVEPVPIPGSVLLLDPQPLQPARVPSVSLDEIEREVAELIASPSVQPRAMSARKKRPTHLSVFGRSSSSAMRYLADDMQSVSSLDTILSPPVVDLHRLSPHSALSVGSSSSQRSLTSSSTTEASSPSAGIGGRRTPIGARDFDL